MQNPEVEKLRERVRLTPEEIDDARADGVNEWLEKHETYTSPRMLARFIWSDELKQFIDKHIAQAQLNKVLNDPDLALIDKDNPIIIGGKTVETVIPLAGEINKEVKE